MDLGLGGKRAIVTGAGSGIGAAIAVRLAAEGANVAVVDIDRAAAFAVADEISGSGRSSLAVECDVRSASDISRAMDQVVGSFSGLEVLVNCAGILGPIQPLVDYDEDDFTRVVDIDLLGTYRMTRAAAPHLLAAGWGRIVNIASISGKEGNAMMTAYAAAKAGVVGFTKSLGRELATTGVLVNCVTPGGVANTKILGDQPLSSSSVTVESHPMGRLAEPAEVAALVAWLCSTELSFTTGGVFDISGGRATY